MARWTLKRRKVDEVKMAKELNISEALALVLGNRGVFTKADFNRFINGGLEDLYDIKTLVDVNTAFEEIKNAIYNRKKIVVYGDYDVDGVMSTVILVKLFKACGAKEVDYYIPNRSEEGYGLNCEAIRSLRNEGCDLLICCDTGISAIDEVDFANSLGMGVIIIDHHEPQYIIEEEQQKQVLPKALAVVDAKRDDSNYPFSLMCAGGLCYKLAIGLMEYMHIPQNKELEVEMLVFGGMATICDVVDLTDENRIIAREALRTLNSNKSVNLGLNKLITKLGFEDKKLSEYHFGFILGPTVNASGRLSSASIAALLFLSENEEDASELADGLTEMNGMRKDLTARYAERLGEEVSGGRYCNDKVIVYYDKDIPESIIGIVAGRIKESFNRPTIILSGEGDNVKGSARSIEGYNIFEELSKQKDLLIRFGGHAMAAGLTMDEAMVDKLRESLNSTCTLSEDDFEVVIRIDAPLGFDSINLRLCNELEALAPFGAGNPKPVFATRQVGLKWLNLVGSEKRIMQPTFEDKNGIMQKGISFNGYDKLVEVLDAYYGEGIGEEKMTSFKKGEIDIDFDILYGLKLNEYQGKTYIQLDIVDIRQSKP